MELAEINFEVEDIGKSRVRIHFTIPVETVKVATEKAFNEIKPRAAIRGFRPGKAPRQLIENQYGAAIRSRVLDNLLPEAYYIAIKQKNLRPVADPSFDSVQFEKGQPLTFNATVEVIKEFNLPEYKQIAIKKSEIKEPADDEVMQVLESHRQYLAKYEPVEDREVREGDFVIIDIVQDIEGRKSEQKNQMVEMNKEKTLPVFVENIVGKKPQEKIEFDFTLPEDYKNKKIAGKTIHYSINLLEIKKKTLPELDDDFAKETGMADTIEKMKEQVKNSIQEDNREKARLQEENQIIEYLVNNTEIEIPPSVLHAQTEDNYRRILQYSFYAGATKEELIEKKEEIQKTASEDSVKQIKTFLILQEIAEREKIDVSEDELNARIADVAETKGMNVADYKKQLEDKKEEKNSIRNRLLREKVIKYLYDNAKIN